MTDKKTPASRKRKSQKRDVLLELRMRSEKERGDEIYIFTEAALAFSEKEYEILPRDYRRGEDADFYIRVTDGNEVALILQYFMPLYLSDKDKGSFGTQNILLPSPSMPAFCNVCRKIDSRMSENGGLLVVEFDTYPQLAPPVSKKVYIHITEDKRK